MIPYSFQKSSPYKKREKLFNFFASTNVMQRIGRAYSRNPVGVASAIALTSIVSKDTLGCYMYVRQSLNNKKIPTEKRGFVAALDLANGVLMILCQLGAFFTVSNDKVQKKMFDATVGKMFSHMKNKAARHYSKEFEELKDLDRTVIQKGLEDYEKVCRNGFKFILPLVASTIIAKRMIVPFIATPVAGWVRKSVLHDEECEPIVEKQNTSNFMLKQPQKPIITNNNNLKEQHKNLLSLSC